MARRGVVAVKFWSASRLRECEVQLQDTALFDFNMPSLPPVYPQIFRSGILFPTLFLSY